MTANALPPWYFKAVIYGVDVARFADSNGDGIGDFAGLMERLPYIAELGATCLWLLPFYDSPRRDNGYDVSDYFKPHPAFGTTDDFLALIHRAGELGLRVIVDLVVNHTSDQHPWFVAARRDRSSRYRDYYVWADTPPAVAIDDKTALPGDEDGVWAYDEVAGAYYFHKFRAFQPDLNVANPEVREEILRILDFWMSLGVSGFRVDAAPFVVGDKGIVRARPHDPQGLLRQMHDVIAKRGRDGLLLGEVNLPPDWLADFFGRGDQLGLLYNFNLTSHLFLALARQKAEPITRCFALLPKPPRRTHWANFLRSLDELNVGRLAETERPEVFDAFAPHETMRIYGRGIRRRLAPILGGDRRRISLALSLLLSLPGVPVIPYGDEIGLGEDLSRPGRDAVRVLMQWERGRNGGFSTAAAGRLITPAVRGTFGPRHVNVADQKSGDASLLSEVRRLIAWRRQHDLVGEAPWEFFDAGDDAVLGHRFRRGGQHLMLLHNISGKAVTAVARVGPSGHAPVFNLLTGDEVVASRGRVHVPLGPFGYCWLSSKKE